MQDETVNEETLQPLESGLPEEVALDVDESLVDEAPVEVADEPEESVEAPKEYVHVPGTVHLNAFEAAVQEAKVKVAQAEAELGAAELALENKKAEAGLL